MAKIIILVVAVLTAFLVWIAFRGIFFISCGSGVTVKAAAVCDVAAHSVRVTMRLTGTQKTYKVTEISVPRDLARVLGVRAPQGFAEQALPLEERLKGDADSVKFVEDFNWANLRWIGELPLTPNREVAFMIPAESPQGGSGTFSFVYSWRGAVLGGVTSFFTADLKN
jgi:hypothetical protein